MIRSLTTLMVKASLFLLSTISASFAAMSIDTDYGSCNYDLSYGGTGLVNINTYYAGDFGVYAGNSINAVKDLSYSCSVSGGGTSTMEVTYSLENTSATDPRAISFIALTDPNGDGLFANDIPKVNFGATSDPAEADAWAVDDFFGNLIQKASVLGQLDNADNCGGSCDLQMAMQWNVIIGAGMTMNFVVSLSEDGTSLSDRFLVSQLDDGLGNGIAPELTMSGLASEVPLPGAVWLLSSALVALVGIGRNRR